MLFIGVVSTILYTTYSHLCGEHCQHLNQIRVHNLRGEQSSNIYKISDTMSTNLKNTSEIVYWFCQLMGGGQTIYLFYQIKTVCGFSFAAALIISECFSSAANLVAQRLSFPLQTVFLQIKSEICTFSCISIRSCMYCIPIMD